MAERFGGAAHAASSILKWGEEAADEFFYTSPIHSYPIPVMGVANCSFRSFLLHLPRITAALYRITNAHPVPRKYKTLLR